LRVNGRATFDRAGEVSIAFTNKSATVTVPGPLSTSTTFPERPSLALAIAANELGRRFRHGCGSWPSVYEQVTGAHVPAIEHVLGQLAEAEATIWEMSP